MTEPEALHPVPEGEGAPQAIPQPGVLGDLEGATEVLLIRHGRSADVFLGSPESADPPLHERGEAQVAALVARLHAKKIDAVYSSELRRAYDTARAIAEPRGLEVQRRHDLAEIRLGEWGGGEFRRRASVRDPEWLAFARSGRWDTIPGEGDASLRGRLYREVSAIIEAHPEQCVAVVAHAGAINAYVAEVLGVERSFFMVIENTSITALYGTNEHINVVTVNDCHHLYDPVLQPPTE